MKLATNLTASPLVGLGLLSVVSLTLAATLPPAEAVVLNNTATLALFGMATNLLLGTTGLLSFGQAIFFGLGSYAVAISWASNLASFWVAAIMGPIIAAIVAAAIGALALRSRKWFFALLMLGFSQLFYTIAQKAYWITEGDSGIFGPMVPDYLAHPRTGSLFIVAATLVSIGLLLVIDRSALGLTLRAIRDNSRRASGLGVNVYATQLLAFVISAFFCAIAGVLTSVNQQSAYPDLLGWTHSGDAVIVAVIGGVNAFFGPVIGAVVYQLGHDVIVRITLRWQLALGLLLLIVVLLVPDGLAGLFRRDTWRAMRRGAAGEAPRP
jgi:branched-chain amino acid transport system permease protein